jgi:predicted ArsR family transcriptional regulator
VAGGLGGTSGHPDGTAVLALLGELGFEPHQDRPGVVVLRNCPFHALAAQQRELICGLNLALVDGLLDGAGIGDLHAELAPRPGACCVELHRDR